MRRVFLADDHGIVLQGIKRLLDQTPDLVVVGEAQHARQVLGLAERASWDLLVLDLSLPGGGGIEVLSRLKQLRPQIRVVVYSMHPEAQYAQPAIEAGARGYVCKARHPETLIEALRAVARGEIFVSGERAAVGPEERTEVTIRERQILQLLAEGRAPSEIATELAVSRSTVSTHIGQLKRKLRVTSIGGLVRRALDALGPGD